MKFDVILTNPPFQDTVKRKRTPHKVWIDFTLDVFDRLLEPGGSLVQVSPASFSSPSNVVLDLMGSHRTRVVRLGTEHHFPDIGSSFSDYWIEKLPNDGDPTTLRTAGGTFEVSLDDSVLYLPNDLSETSLRIHAKTMFAEHDRLPVEWDYVTAHNIRRYDDEPTLVTERDDEHPYPVFHTNRSTWWSSIRQDWADEQKVMWTRSGYTKPFFDDGELGGTDMVYFVRVDSADEGHAVVGNLQSELYRYLLKTARWSGFGNERVFTRLPDVPRDRVLTDEQMFDRFELEPEEVSHVRASLEPRRRTAR